MKDQIVYIVLKNVDFTEGRGPMVYHKTFETFKAAEQYVMSNTGIYGSSQKRSPMSDKQPYPYDGYKNVAYNGYAIISDVVNTGPTYEDLVAEMSFDTLVSELGKVNETAADSDRMYKMKLLVKAINKAVL